MKHSTKMLVWAKHKLYWWFSSWNLPLHIWTALTLLALASVAADGVDALFAASASKASAGTLVDVLAPVVVGVHLKAGL